MPPRIFVVPVWDAVLHRHDHRVRAAQVPHVVGHRVELVRLHRQHHDIVHAGGAVVVGGAHVERDLLAAVGRNQFDAVEANSLQIGAAHEERDLVADQCQLGSQIPAEAPAPMIANFMVP